MRLDLGIVVLGLVAGLVAGVEPAAVATVSLDVVEAAAVAPMGLDLGLVALALLVRHCSSFGILAPLFGAVISPDVLGRTNLPIEPSISQATLRCCTA
jgi:hypothetical protein